MFDAFSGRPRHCCAALAFAAFVPALVSHAAHAAGPTDVFPVTAAQMQALGVQLQRLEAGSEVAGLSYPARVVLPPRQQQLISAPLAGVVDQLLVSDNDAVKPGQPLLRLLSPELGELQLRLMEAAARSGLAVKTLQRERALFGEGIIPERRVQEAEAAAAEGLARRRQAEAALRLAGLDDATIRRVADGGGVTQSTLTVRARSAGVVSELAVKPGQRVQQADALLQIADTRRLWLDVQIPLSRRHEMATAKGGKLTLLGHEGISATVLSVGAAASDGQTLTLRAEVSQGGASLRVGEFVQARLPFAGTGDGWAVPQQAVARQGDRAFVFVRTEQGFVAKPVTVLASGGQTLRVKGDLQAGQQIATAAVIALKAAWQGKSGGN
jgi:RND family efflux transporter MFP subunit